MQPRQFFDDVNLALDIQTPARDVDQIAIFAVRQQREAETRKDAVDFERAEFFA